MHHKTAHHSLYPPRAASRVHRVFVVDDEGRLKKVISLTDILRFLFPDHGGSSTKRAAGDSASTLEAAGGEGSASSSMSSPSKRARSSADDEEKVKADAQNFSDFVPITGEAEGAAE
jgi:hypothetical protein